MQEVYLTEIRKLPDEGQLELTWDDGHTARFDNDYLRGYCPCAGCQGHGTGEVKFRQPENSVESLEIRPVGNYAISIQWSDAHDTGIYRFDFLRQICPCADCREDLTGRAATESQRKE